MKFDSYAPCPGGRPQKLKFCCSDLHKELENLHGMLEDGEFDNVFPILDRLAPSHPNCACLDSVRITALMHLGRLDEAHQLAKAFREREPDNLLASSTWAEVAAAAGLVHEALHTIIDAVEKTPSGQLMRHQFQALVNVGSMWCGTPVHVTSTAIVFCLMQHADEVKTDATRRLYLWAVGAADIPIILRTFEWPKYQSDFVAKEAMNAVLDNVITFRWKSAIAGLRLLNEHAATFPAILWLTARLQIALLDHTAAKQTLTDYLALTSLSDDERLDAEVLRRYISDDALGDVVTPATLAYTLSEDAYPLEVIASSRRLAVIPNDPGIVAPDGVAPLRTFLILDRPRTTEQPTLGEDGAIDATAIPHILAMALFFGKQTDRPTRLEVVPLVLTQRPNVETQIRELFADHIVSCEEELQVPASVTQTMLQNNYFLEHATSDEQLDDLAHAYTLGDFVDAWLALPLGILDGKRPCDVIGDANYRWPLLAAVEIVKDYAGPPFSQPLAARLRERLGLPAEATLELSDDALTRVNLLESVPIWRWHRLDLERLPHAILQNAFYTARVYNEASLQTLLAEEILARPMNDIEYRGRALAFEHLKEVALAEHNTDEALVWVDRARNEAVARNINDCHWDCAEFRIRLRIGPLERANELLELLVQKHSDHPEVQEIMGILAQMEVQARNQAAASASSPQGVASEVSASSSGASGLWTPGQTSGLPAGTASPIWTP